MTNIFRHDHQMYVTMIDVFKFESYLTYLLERLHIFFTQFKLGNKKLLIETSRLFSIDRNERYCILC